jgi:hypothetical protein
MAIRIPMEAALLILLKSFVLAAVIKAGLTLDMDLKEALVLMWEALIY